MIFAGTVGASRPHRGFSSSVMRRKIGSVYRSLNSENDGTTGCRDTALLTIVVTCGSSPATADIMKLVDPWQWTTALRCSSPVSRSTAFTASGWS